MRKALRAMSMATAVGTLAVIGLSGASPALADATGQTGSAFYGSGSDTTYGMMSSIDQLYNGLPGCGNVNSNAPPFTESAQCVDNQNPTSPNQVHDNSSERYPLNSGTGRRELCDQGQPGVVSVGFGRSSSAISAASANDCVNETSIAYAQDAVTAFAYTSIPGNDSTDKIAANGATGASFLPTVASANPTGLPGNENPVNPATQPALTQANLTAVYTATEDTLGHAIKTAASGTEPEAVYTWHDLGANDNAYAAGISCPVGNADGTPTVADPVCQPIIIYSAPNGSGTVSTFNGILGTGNTAFGKITGANATLGNHIIEENNALPIAAQGNAANGLFFYSYGRYTANRLAGANAPVDATSGALLAISSATTAANTAPPVDEANIQKGSASGLVGYRKVFNVERYATPAIDRYVGFGGYICATGRDLTLTAGTVDENSAVTQRIRLAGFVPFGLQTNEGDPGTTKGYCQFGATIADNQTVAASISPAVVQGDKSVAVYFGGTGVINANNSNITLSDATTGQQVAATVACEDFQQRATPCSLVPSDAPTGTALVTPAGGFAAGDTYTVSANTSITDRGRQPLTAFSQSFASPTAPPQTITKVVTVPGPTNTNTVTKTVTVTTSVPTLVVGKAIVSGTSVKVPVTCVDANCNGTLTLQEGKKKVTKIFRLHKGQTSTISAKLSRPKGAKTGKTSVSYKVTAIKGQSVVGTKNGRVKI